jgi:hypothetical protein
MASEDHEPRRQEGAAFGIEVADVDVPRADEPPGAAGLGDSEVDAIIHRAGQLTEVQVGQLAAAVAWHWVPLGLPASGSVAGARAAAIAHARRTGRAGAIAAAGAAARAAAAGSPGGHAGRATLASAETALATVLIGFGGAIAFGVAGMALPAVACAIAGAIGAFALLFVESRYVRRLRLNGAVDAAILAAATRDLIDDETYTLLSGPWSTVMRD